MVMKSLRSRAHINQTIALDYLHICVTKFYTKDFKKNVKCLVVSIIYIHLKKQ